MDTFYQIAVIGLIGATKLTLQKLKEALEECRR